MRATLAVALTNAEDTHITSLPENERLPTLGNIIGAFKSLVTTSYLKILKDRNPDIILGKLWQRNYFERIIKNEEDLRNATFYVQNNPKNWEKDELR